MNKQLLVFFVVILSSTGSNAQQYTVETVPNTKLVNNSYVSNPDSILDENTVSRINSLLQNLESQNTAQVSVVMLNSIGDEDIFDFAQQLFNTWGIGQSTNDNGLLVLFVQDQRTLRFHTGYGIEGVLTDATCKEIQRQFMVPHFKNGDYNTGMFAGIEQVAAILDNPEVAASLIPQGPTDEEVYYSALLLFTPFIMLIAFFVVKASNKFSSTPGSMEVRISKFKWLLLYVVLPLVVTAISYIIMLPVESFFLCFYGLIIFLLLEKRVRASKTATPLLSAGDNQGLHQFYKQQKNKVIFSMFLFPFPMLLVFFYYRYNQTRYRNLPRKCKLCNGMSVKLAESQEDEFLTTAQIAEEKVQSTDYDVWKCSSCNATELLRYPSSKKDYTNCPECKALTYHFGKKRTLQRATYSADGLGETERNCFNCGHRYVDSFILPMLVASTSASSSHSGSSSSSSSSSGGSWGGGVQAAAGQAVAGKLSAISRRWSRKDILNAS
jgi:uncharacterized protein